MARTSSTATNCSSKFWKIHPAVHFLTSTMKQQSLFAYLTHVSQSSHIYFKTLFLSVPFCIDHRRFTAGIKLFHTGNVHAHLSPRLVAGLQAVPYTHCEKFCQFHQVSRSSPICSVSVLCHSVHIHSSNAHTLAQRCMRAYSSPRWQLQWEAYEDTQPAQSMAGQVTVFSFFAPVTIHYYIYSIWPTVCYRNPQQ